MATLPVDFRFGSAQFSRANGFIITQFEDRPLVDSRFRDAQSGAFAYFEKQRLRGRDITIRGVLRGDPDSESLRDRMDAQLSRLLNSEDYLSVYAAPNERRILCGITRMPSPRYIKGTEMSVVTWDMSFRSKHFSWEALTPKTEVWDITTQSSSHAFAAVNAGVFDAHPVIKIQNRTGAAISNCDFVLTETAAVKQYGIYGVELGDNDTLWIDTQRGRVGQPGFDDVHVALVDGQPLSIPAQVAPTIQVRTNLASFGANGLRVTVEWRDQFLSP